MDEERYKTDEGYRRRIDGARRGGRSRSRKKVESSRRNIAKSPGRPRKDGLAPKWQERGLDPREAEREHREHEAAKKGADKRQVMKGQGWPLEKEWEFYDQHFDAGTYEEMERETADHIEREGGVASRSIYLAWCEGGRQLTGNEDIPDGLLRMLCRYRLLGSSETQEATQEATVDGFAI